MDKEDLKKAMQDAQSMQVDLVKLQAELAHSTVVGQSKHGEVLVAMNADGSCQRVQITGNPGLELLVRDAINDAFAKSAAITQKRLKKISEKIGL